MYLRKLCFFIILLGTFKIPDLYSGQIPEKEPAVLIEAAAPQQRPPLLARVSRRPVFDSQDPDAPGTSAGAYEAPQAPLATQHADITSSIQRHIEELNRRGPMFSHIQSQQHRQESQPQQIDLERLSAPTRLMLTLKTQLAQIQDCTRQLRPLITQRASGIQNIHTPLDSAYRFLIIDNIVRSIKFLRHQDAPQELTQICTKLNELNHNGYAHITFESFANIRDSELHNLIEIRIHDRHQLEALQLSAMTNEIIADIKLALPQRQQETICKKFNELVDQAKDQLNPKQRESFHLTPANLMSLQDTQKRLLDLNQNLMPFHQFMRQLVNQHIQQNSSEEELKQHAQTIAIHKETLAKLLTRDTPSANGRTIIDETYDAAGEIINLHHTLITNCFRTIDELIALLNNFIGQENNVAENSDCNLVREIVAFFESTKERLTAAHNKLTLITAKVKETTDAIKKLQRIYDEMLDIETLETQSSHKKALAYITGTIKAQTAHYKEYAVREKILPAQEILERTINNIESFTQQLSEVATVERTTMRNLKTLCTILDPYENPQFHIIDQDNIEESFEKNLAQPYLRHLTLKASQWVPSRLKFLSDKFLFKKIMQLLSTTESQDRLRQVPEREPYYPLAGQIVYGGIHLVQQASQFFQREQAPPQENLHLTDDPQQEQTTFDDRITTWAMDTKNPQYLLYDIATRTRFNTGRLTPMIKRLIYGADRYILGGPYGEVDDGQNPEDLLRYPEFKVDEHGNPMYKMDDTGNPELDSAGKPKLIPIRKYINLAEKQHEAPGDRFNDLMQMLTASSFFIKHPWLILMVPPGVIRSTESILRVASQRAYPGEWLAAPPLPQAPNPVVTAEQPFVSTSCTSFIWNSIKRLSHWSIHHVHSLMAQSLHNCNHFMQQTFNILTNPFQESMPYRLIATTATKTTDYIRPKMHELKVNSARKFRSVLCYFAASKVRQLESKIRKKRPISDLLDRMHRVINQYSTDEVTTVAKALIANNADTIRAGIETLSTFDRIKPLGTSVKHPQLRETLGHLAAPVFNSIHRLGGLAAAR